MFQASLNQFSSTVGDSNLIPVTSLDENKKFNVLNIVFEKSKGRFLWHKSIYKTTNYMLHDLLSKPDNHFEKDIDVRITTDNYKCNSK